VAADSAVLLMAYGTPERLDQVPEYFAHIRGGRQPSSEAIANLRGRYERIGGATPLRRITEAVRDALAAELAGDGTASRVHIGMKHWHPFIAEAMEKMRDEGVRRVTAIALAPHYSKMSVGAYRHAVEEAHAALGAPFELRFVERWHAQPLFLELMADLVRQGLSRFPPSERQAVAVVFSAHSLPVRIRQWADPYESELMASSAAVARLAGLPAWHFAWQSAGGTGEPWIGPDILDFLGELQKQGVRNVLQVPIGFVCDHLEILYDIDIEAKEKARELGMVLHRTELPNASAPFIRTLAAVVRDAARPVGAE
jgi:protoporphyrin/coproporphyrin ferrochelatase